MTHSYNWYMFDYAQDHEEAITPAEAVQPQELAYSPLKLREVRKKRRISQMGLAKITGLSRMTIQSCERAGANPTHHVLLVLGKALDVVWYADWQNRNSQKDSSHL